MLPGLYVGDDGFGYGCFRFAGTADTKPLDGYHQAVLYGLHYAINNDPLFYMLPQLSTDVITDDAVSLLIITGDVDFCNLTVRCPRGCDNDAAY